MMVLVDRNRMPMTYEQKAFLWLLRGQMSRPVGWARREGPEATCWCSIGALWAVAPHGSERAVFVPDAIDALHRVARAAGFTNAIGLNDAGRHDAVMKMYADAIEAARPA